MDNCYLFTTKAWVNIIDKDAEKAAVSFSKYYI